MGGKVAILMRTSKGEKISFKTHTNNFGALFNSAKILDEDNIFKYLNVNKISYDVEQSYIAHGNYENNGALFAPYMYGLLLIDYLEKKVFSYNNYCGYLLLSTDMALNSLNYSICLCEEKVASNSIGISDGWHGDPWHRVSDQILIASPDDKYRLNDEEISFSGVGGFISAILEREGIEINHEDIRESLAKYIDVRKRYIWQFENHNYLQILPHGWNIYNGDADDVMSAMEYCCSNGLLTEEDEHEWDKFLIEQNEREIE